MRLGWRGGWGVVCPPVLDLCYFDSNDLWVIIGQIKWGCWAAQREVPVSPFTRMLTSGPAPSHVAVRRQKSAHIVGSVAAAPAVSESSGGGSLEKCMRPVHFEEEETHMRK